MKKALLITLLVLGILVVAGMLVCTGIFIGRHLPGVSAQIPGYQLPAWQGEGPSTGQQFGPGMMMGPGMMNGNPNRNGWRGDENNRPANVPPLTVEQASQAANDYLARLNLSDLKISEVLVFENIAVVRVLEQGTGIGAFDLFVDPVSQSVIPTMGPSTAWNIKYGNIVHAGMMGGWSNNEGTLIVPSNVTAEMTITPEEAVSNSQSFLDEGNSGATADSTAQTFYGYYSIKVLKDGKVIGILSVNGTNGQVFMPDWFGDFVTSEIN